MKKHKKIQLLILSTLLFTFSSCVEKDDFETPNISIKEPDIDAKNITSIDAVAGIYIQEYIDENNIDVGDYNPDDDFDDSISFTFDSNNSLYTVGYVISSDEAGNFFEELTIQDKLENPTYGLKILVDVNPLYTNYEVGRKIYVKLSGLTIGISNGVLALGLLQGERLEKIPAPMQNTQILRSTEKGILIPKVIDITTLSDRMTNQYVSIQNAQFNKREVLGNNPLTFAAEPLDEFDGERTLESCDGGSITFSTSTFSDFKGLKLPSGKGAISGVLEKDFFGNFYTFVVNTPESINFDSQERCDPNVLECTNPINGASTTTIFSEDFETFGTFASEGWTNTNISGGTTQWDGGRFGGNAYVQISGFNAGEDEINVWLVTPTINLDSSTQEELNFDVQTNFNNGDVLTVWISSDFTGDPTTATWEQLDTAIPTGSTTGFGSFTPATTVNLSCLNGDIHIGFFYQGSDPSDTTRYHIDNIEVSGK